VPPIASTKPKQRQGNPSTLHRAPARLALQANRFPRPAVYIYTRRGQDGSVGKQCASYPLYIRFDFLVFVADSSALDVVALALVAFLSHVACPLFVVRIHESCVYSSGYPLGGGGQNQNKDKETGSPATPTEREHDARYLGFLVFR